MITTIYIDRLNEAELKTGRLLQQKLKTKKKMMKLNLAGQQSQQQQQKSPGLKVKGKGKEREQSREFICQQQKQPKQHPTRTTETESENSSNTKMHDKRRTKKNSHSQEGTTFPPVDIRGQKKRGKFFPSFEKKYKRIKLGNKNTKKK